jgi:hypothetical protein
MNKFKIGDWVRVTSTIICGDVVLGEGVYETTNTKNFDRSSIFNSKEALGKVERWEPKLDEWCWIKHYEYGTRLCKIINVDDKSIFIPEANKHVQYVEYTGQDIDDKLCWGTICEPFIGALPSFIKDN